MEVINKVLSLAEGTANLSQVCPVEVSAALELVLQPYTGLRREFRVSGAEVSALRQSENPDPGPYRNNDDSIDKECVVQEDEAAGDVVLLDYGTNRYGEGDQEGNPEDGAGRQVTGGEDNIQQGVFSPPNERQNERDDSSTEKHEVEECIRSQ